MNRTGDVMVDGGGTGTRILLWGFGRIMEQKQQQQQQHHGVSWKTVVSRLTHIH